MDLTQLRTLVSVAELGSLSKAADRLCIAQPALSRQVRMLEDELGTRLFDRHGRGMVVTEQGRVVLRHALRVLKELDDIKLAVAEDAHMLGGHVSIGLPPTVSELIAEPLIASLSASHPAARCRIVSAYSLYLFDWIHRGEIDVAVLYDPQSIRSLKCEPLIEERLYVVGPTLSGLEIEAPVSLRALEGKPMLLPSMDHSLRQIVERAAHDAGIGLSVKVEVDSYGLLKRLVMSGHGWTILPFAPVREDVEASRLCAAPLTDTAAKRLLQLAFPADRPVSRLAMAARDAIVTAVAAKLRDGH